MTSKAISAALSCPGSAPRAVTMLKRCQSHFILFGNPPPSLPLHVGGTESVTNSRSSRPAAIQGKKRGVPPPLQPTSDASGLISLCRRSVLVPEAGRH